MDFKKTPVLAGVFYFRIFSAAYLKVKMNLCWIIIPSSNDKNCNLKFVTTYFDNNVLNNWAYPFFFEDLRDLFPDDVVFQGSYFFHSSLLGSIPRVFAGST